jgi:hypothetical protein
LNHGCPYVLDAELQQYFDTIVHDKLMKLIAGRISDRHILGSINQTFAWSCACECARISTDGSTGDSPVWRKASHRSSTESCM